MINSHLKSVLDRVANWPDERQQELAEIALAIEAEMSNRPYQATSDELQAIDEGLAGGTASEEEINTAYAKFSSDEGRVRKTRPLRRGKYR